MNHLEIEYKTLLDKEEYQSLLPLFADTELVVQTNHYIDTPDQLMSKEKMALRVRTFTDQAELTLKVPEAVSSTIRTSAQKKPRRSFNTNSFLTEKSKTS